MGDICIVKPLVWAPC